MLGMFLPGAELMLHCEVYGAEGSERAMLVEALDKLGPDNRTQSLSCGGGRLLAYFCLAIDPCF